ncbi:MAG TPA: BolA/IbaG family iron-sulfur metabolism protein [Candidatus Tenderia sp.]|nr:BolA/IbaG family iron-sulfur metabolism protein [Candidatus Tenderia sp.]
MEINQVQEIVSSVVPGADIRVDGEGCSFSVTVVSEQFEGQSLLNRQRSVMAAFRESLASGELHALSVKAYTPDEIAAKK